MHDAQPHQREQRIQTDGCSRGDCQPANTLLATADPIKREDRQARRSAQAHRAPHLAPRIEAPHRDLLHDPARNRRGQHDEQRRDRLRVRSR